MLSHQESDEIMPPSGEEMHELMTQKAHELFRVCDSEEKGFITKRDMQKLQSELPLSPDQLEHVFDSLDDDGNGFLTLEEFTDGFGSFLGLRTGPTDNSVAMDTDNVYADDQTDPQEEAHHFKQMLNNVGAHGLYDDEHTIQAMWCRLRKEDSDMASNFEDFLYKVTNEIKRSKADFDSLENALKSKTSAHDEEVRKLYEEMESQIKAEKDKILQEERAKERQLRETLENEMYEKDKQLQDLMSKHTEIEDRLGHLNTIEVETKLENDKLQKEKEDLQESLLKSQDGLEESRAYINQLREQQKEEKRERARAALKLTEGIAIERETLVKQLDILKSMNKKLLDDKDEAEIRRMGEASPRRESPRKGELERQGSVLGKYFNPKRTPKLPSCDETLPEEVGGESRLTGIHDDSIECDDDVYIDGQAPSFIHNTLDSFQHSHVTSSPKLTRVQNYQPYQQNQEPYQQNQESYQQNSFDASDDNHSESENAGDRPRSNATPYTAALAVTKFVTPTLTSGLHSESNIPDTPRAQPVGADGQSEANSQVDPAALQRVFKIVFVGDSGVGKSSFIQRFCLNHFKQSYAATIGVDFQIKSLIIEGQVIVLQLWDTAGQERFRSITKQYFRKADGVIVMYDVTSEATFTNVRNWMTSVKEGVSEDAVIVLLGNKSDLPEDDTCKAVKMKAGSRLADEYESLFYETSALSGENVHNSMEALARLLKEKEDIAIEKSLRLEDTPQKKGCCG